MGMEKDQNTNIADGESVEKEQAFDEKNEQVNEKKI